VRRKKIYPESVIDLNEAMSGSYLFHFAAMVTFFILALFFLVPKPPVAQITEFEFVEPTTHETKHVKSKFVSTNSATESGRHNPNKHPPPHPRPTTPQQTAPQPAATSPSQPAAQQNAVHQPTMPAKPQLSEAKPAQSTAKPVSAPALPAPRLNQPN